MRFWLGTHKTVWLEREPDLFVSRRALTIRKRLPVAIGDWALDSGGFTELEMFGEWRTSEDEYVADVLRFQSEIGRLQWAAPMDWMCEPFMLTRTGKSIDEHQDITVANFLRLRERLGPLVIPVLQGWLPDDYLRCVDLYEAAGVSLIDEPLVGVGSVCRRQSTTEAAVIFRSLLPLRLHGFGVKVSGLAVYADALASADSLSWSARARRDFPLPGCTHAKCTNCLRYARRWRERIQNDILGQQRMEIA